MVILLNKSIGLDEAKELLREIGVESPAAIKIMAQKMVHLLIKISGVKSVAANIIKQEMLAVGGDAAVSHGVIDLSVATTDVLIMGTYEQIHRSLQMLKIQPFGLATIADEIEHVLEANDLREISKGGEGRGCCQ